MLQQYYEWVIELYSQRLKFKKKKEKRKKKL